MMSKKVSNSINREKAIFIPKVKALQSKEGGRY